MLIMSPAGRLHAQAIRTADALDGTAVMRACFEAVRARFDGELGPGELESLTTIARELRERRQRRQALERAR